MKFTVVASRVSVSEPGMHSTGFADRAWGTGWGGHIASTQGILQCMGVASNGNSLIPCMDPCNHTCAAKTAVPLVAVFGLPIQAAQASTAVQPAGAVGLV